ncbi:MFS transporter [Candidatus Paracaedibacter symbiosus]|uniref:MFS transporter n=1 Tax=Candidatus Paracaedibacter symbiosus TaxID=244582 RepID=UPI000689B4A7|nr:MFS transporter [Candidatus Paracaedibacter symbiosus]
MESLKPYQKKSFALIQIGAFLEYFDLYLYVHMAVVLNEVFFPKTDPYTASLIAAFTFSSTYLLRPLGALVFGYLGDNFGRKSTIVITTSIMAFCSFVIASLPSYEKIGLTASVVMILCRMLQGFSSIGEFIGALTYVTESTTPPRSYFYTSLVAFFTSLGSTFALLIGSVFLIMNSADGWRTAFYFGAAIAVVGSVARTQLRETPEFLQEKLQNKTKHKKISELLPSQKTKKNFLCYLGVECLRPLYFYFSFIYLGQILRTQYGYSAAEVIYHNLFISGIEALAILAYGRLALKIFPLKILKVRGTLFLGFALCLPMLINHASSPVHLFLIQCGLLILGEGVTPAHALFLKAFPTIGRYTQAAVAYALSRIVTTLLTSYGCVFVGEYYGIEGITTFLVGVILIHLTSIYHFDKQQRGIQELVSQQYSESN